MKPLVFALAVSLVTMTLAAQQTTTDTTGTATPSKPVDSPLVRAAKASGGPKKKLPKKVITNADVKKSHGKIIVLPEKKGPPAPPATSTAPPAKGPLALHEEHLKAENAAAQRVTTAEKKVAELEKELRRLEDAYYAENDPTYRDTTITTRFNQTKRQLEEARKELADARDAQEKLNKPSS